MILRILSLIATVVIVALLVLSQLRIRFTGYIGTWGLIIPFVGIQIAYRVCSTPDERWWTQHAYCILYYLCTDRQHALLYAKWNRQEW